MEIPKGFYVYTLTDPRTDLVFYVGKGKGLRLCDHEGEARGRCGCCKCEKIRSIWRSGFQVIRKIVYTTPDEADAYAFEKSLIESFGFGKLTNIKNGKGPHRPEPVAIEIDPDDPEEEAYIIRNRRYWKRLDYEEIMGHIHEWRMYRFQYLTLEYKEARRFNRDPEKAAALNIEIEIVRRKLLRKNGLDLNAESNR